MKQIIRRMMAVMLCAVFALASPLASAQDMTGTPELVLDFASLWASLTVTMPDGSQQNIPVTTVTTTLGDIVYWVDQSTLTPEQISALPTGQFVLVTQEGATVAQFSLAENPEVGYVPDEPLYFTSSADSAQPPVTIAIVFSSGVSPAPATPEEADAYLALYGFATPAPEGTEPEITEPEVTEPEITEPEVTEPEITTPEVVVPPYVTAGEEGAALYQTPYVLEDAFVAEVWPGDVLTVSGYETDDNGSIWWMAADYRSGLTGYVLSADTVELDEEAAFALMAQIDAEQTQEPATEETSPPPTETDDGNAELITPPPTDEGGTEETSPPPTETDDGNAELITPPPTDEGDTEETSPPPTETDDGNAELITPPPTDEGGAEETSPPPTETVYAVTNNKNSDINNLRDAVDGSVVQEIPNGVLVVLGEGVTGQNGNLWYPVTVVQSGVSGYMRDYLVTQITYEDAMNRLQDITTPDPVQSDPPADNGDTVEQTEPPLVSLITPGPEQTGEPEGTEPTDPPTDTDVTYATEFPAYGITLEQENGAVIILLSEPGGDPPQSGAIPSITEPTPLELTSLARDGSGAPWYLARNMNTGESGYVEVFKVRLVTQEEAMAAIKTETETPIPPAPTEIPEETPTPQPTPTPTPVPQELTAGDVYHYGRNTGTQVALRRQPNTNGDLIMRMEAGTILWVMQCTEGDLENAWCYVRTDRGEGYVMAKFVQLMGAEEEAEYRASLDDPEMPPTPTEEPTAQPTDSPEPTQEPTAQPTDSPEPTATPAPQPMQTYGRITQDNVALRANPQDSAALQTMLSSETVISISQSQVAADGSTWYLAQYDGQWGYVHADFVRLMSEQEIQDYLAQLEAAQATPTPTAEPTATPVPTATPAPQELRVYARVISDGTPLRGNPDANAYLQTILNKETVVYVFQSQIATDGMTWYLVQYSGQWGYVRADLVRLMDEQEMEDYLAQLEAERATPTPQPQATPEPFGPDATSAYAQLIRDAVNLHRTPSASGTSLVQIPINTLLLVTGTEDDGTYTWYQVNYNGQDGYVRSDMAKMLTIAELQAYLAEQAAATPRPGASAATTPNSSNNVDNFIPGTTLLPDQFFPSADSWDNNVISGMPGHTTSTPDPNATPTPQPVSNPAALISSYGDLRVNNVPAVSENGTFTVYGTTTANGTVTATITLEVQSGATALPTATPDLVGAVRFELFAAAYAEGAAPAAQGTQTVIVGEAVADENGAFVMDVTFPEEGEYIVEFTSGTSYARYGVTYDSGVSPEPTVQPLPTAQPVEEEGGMGILPFVIGGLLIVVAAAIYGIYVYRRRTEEAEEEEAEEDEDEEAEIREEQLMQQRARYAQTPPANVPGQAAAPRMPQNQAGQIPSYMKNTPTNPAQANPYGKPAAPVAPKAPTMPVAPVAPKAPTMPAAPVAPKAPTMPAAPTAPKAPTKPAAPVVPKAPAAPITRDEREEPAEGDQAPRRRRRPPADPEA